MPWSCNRLTGANKMQIQLLLNTICQYNFSTIVYSRYYAQINTIGGGGGGGGGSCPRRYRIHPFLYTIIIVLCVFDH